MPFDEEEDVSGTTGSSASTGSTPAPNAGGGAVQPSQAPAPQNANAGQMQSIGATPPGSQDNSSTPSQPQAQKPWYQRVYTGVLDALGGSNQVMLERDPQSGKMVATATKSGPGQQWKRIISGALAGAGSAMAHAGTGPGAAIRGAGLGIEAGMKLRNDQAQQARTDADEDFQQQQTAALNKARTAELSQQGAKAAWELGWEKQKALQGQLDLENQWNDRIAQAGQGSGDLGVFPTFKDYISATKENPDLHDAQAHGQLYAITHVNADGVQDGVHVYRVTPGWKDQKTTEATPFPVMKTGDKIGDPPRFETQTIPAGAMTNGQAMDYVQAQNNKALELQLKVLSEKSQAEERRAAAAKDYADASKPPKPSAEENREAQEDQWGPGGARGFNQWHNQQVKPALDVEQSYDLASAAHNAYYDALAKGQKLPTGAQSMQLLAQHIRTTFGSGPGGARQTQAMIEQHLGARGISDTAQVAVNKLINGDALSKNQMDAFTEMIANSRELKWRQVLNDAVAEGRPLNRIAIPADLRSKWGLGPAPQPNRGQQPQGAPNSQPQAQPQSGGFNWDAHPVAN